MSEEISLGKLLEATEFKHGLNGELEEVLLRYSTDVVHLDHVTNETKIYRFKTTEETIEFFEEFVQNVTRRNRRRPTETYEEWKEKADQKWQEQSPSP